MTVGSKQLCGSSSAVIGCAAATGVLLPSTLPAHDPCLTMSRFAAGNDVESKQPLAIVYSAAFGDDKASTYSRHTPIDKPLQLEGLLGLRWSVEQHYFAQLARLTWGLKSGEEPNAFCASSACELALCKMTVQLRAGALPIKEDELVNVVGLEIASGSGNQKGEKSSMATRALQALARGSFSSSSRQMTVRQAFSQRKTTRSLFYRLCVRFCKLYCQW